MQCQLEIEFAIQARGLSRLYSLQFSSREASFHDGSGDAMKESDDAAIETRKLLVT